MTTIIMLSIASFLAVSLLKLTLQVQHVDEKRNDGIKAFYIAEAARRARGEPWLFGPK